MLCIWFLLQPSLLGISARGFLSKRHAGRASPSLHLACSPAPALPSKMTAVHLTHKLCFTPFTSCIKTHTVDVPSPGPGQVLIEVKGSSVNPCDVDYAEYSVGCSGGGGTLGMDMAGTVVAVGADVNRLKVGDDGGRTRAPRGATRAAWRSTR